MATSPSNREFQWSLERGTELRLKLTGFINGSSDLKQALDKISGAVVVDLGDIIRINSLGIQQWIEFLGQACAKAQVTLDRCSPVMVQQFALIKQARGNTHIRSVLLPYYCDRCRKDTLHLVDVANGPRPLIPLQSACPSCGGDMRFDDLPQYYTFAGPVLKDELLGKKLGGEYEIVECIGAGAMSRVYRAIQRRCLGRSVAVKVLNAIDDTLVRRMENEARVIGQLRHPNTVKLVDFGRTGNGAVYLVTELLLGETLEARLRRGPLTPHETLRIIAHVSDSLAEAHAAGIVHRDLRPANIFIERIGAQEVVKVLDFGLAKILDSPGFTQPMIICGTPQYMSPEQARAESIDSRSDFYSLGAVAYECLTGRPLFTGSTPVSVIRKHILDEPVPPDTICPQVGPDLSAFVQCMLAKDPDHRPKNAGEIRSRLEAIDRDLNSLGGAPYLHAYDETTVAEDVPPPKTARFPAPQSRTVDQMSFHDLTGISPVDREGS